MTPQDFSAHSPDFRIVEASIRVSANLSIPDTEVGSITYKFKFPKTVEVADHLPKTQLDTDLAGNITTTERRTAGDTMKVTAEANGKVGFSLPLAGKIETGISGNKERNENKEVTSGINMSQLPPKQLVVGVGTEDRGQTLWFTLRPFSQNTFVGQREFAVLLIVPKDWSGDRALLSCTATGADRKNDSVVKELAFGLFPAGNYQSKRKIEREVETYAGAFSVKWSSHSEGNASQSLATTTVLFKGLKEKICSTKYQIESGGGRTVYNFKSDGTYTSKYIPSTTEYITSNAISLALGSLDATTDLSDMYDGKWHYESNKLTLIRPASGGFFGSSEQKIIDADPVIQFDNQDGTIWLKSGKKLTQYLK